MNQNTGHETMSTAKLKTSSIPKNTDATITLEMFKSPAN